MHGPVFYAVTRLATRRELRKSGLRQAQVNDLMDACDDDVIDAAEVAASVAPADLAKIGDGTILQAIIDFLKSDAGQALLKALVTMLLTLLVP